MAEETIKKIALGDTRTAGEKVSGMIARAVSPDKAQNRSIEDSPTKMAQNRAATEKRIADEKLKR